MTATGVLKSYGVDVKLTDDGKAFVWKGKKFPPGVYYLVKFDDGRVALISEKMLNEVFADDVFLWVPVDLIKECDYILEFKKGVLDGIVDKGLEKALEESIKKFGIVKPLITDREYRLIDGYFRLRVAKKFGINKVPVLRRSYDAYKDPEKAFADLVENDIIRAEQLWENLKRICRKTGFELCRKLKK